jgi:hypothetical protein
MLQPSEGLDEGEKEKKNVYFLFICEQIKPSLRL